MDPIELAYVLFSSTAALAGVTMVGLAVHAYRETERSAMFHLSVGFTLVVAAVLTTMISGVLSAFQAPQTLLAVQYALLTVGFLLIVYSILVE